MTNNFRSKKEIVYSLLREDILSGTYKPGSRLVIDEIAANLNVSQIPIREAIGQLEADGFVTTEPYVGATVTDIDANFIFEVFAILEALEVISTRAICNIVTESQIDTIAGMIAEMDKAVDEPNRWSELNKEMHLFICRSAKTSLVEKMIMKAFDHWDRLRFHYLRGVSKNRILEAQVEHKLMLEAIREHDADKAEQIIREHNQSALKSYIRHLKSEGHLASGEDTPS